MLNHPEYKQDSIVTDRIAYDLTKRLVDISYGKVQDENFPRIFPENIFNKEPEEFLFELEK